MKNWMISLAAGVLLSASLVSQAEEDKSYQQVKNKIEQTIGFDVISIADAPISGLLQVSTNQGLFYTSKDGNYLMQGRIFNVNAGMRNETEVALSEMRIDGLSDFTDSVIEFKAKNEQYVVNVFTDITCGYCRKLHAEIEQYNKNGITVRYLAFPRGGLSSESYLDMVSVWCAKDQQKAMTIAKSSGEVSRASCENSVAQQYAFGQRVGVSGTPNIILPDGSMVPGYQPANTLLNSLREI